MKAQFWQTCKYLRINMSSQSKHVQTTAKEITQKLQMQSDWESYFLFGLFVQLKCKDL